ncbi:hypothetical protein P9112_011179 [Eukaryota sp. TZLM1-RC]
MPSSVPLLPFYNVRDYSSERNYSKKHIFDYSCALPVIQNETLNVSSHHVDLDETDTDFLNTIPKKSINSTIYGQYFTPSYDQYVPAYIRNDKVLRFFGYFLEAVHDSPQETFRVRLCKIDYFLVDHTIQVLETVEENSGLPQGVLLRRIATELKPSDLSIGQVVTLYGKNIKIYDCLDATRKYFAEELLIDLPPPLECPLSSKEPLSKFNRTSTITNTGASEVVKWRQSFLQNDGKILRFYCTSKDPVTSEVFDLVLHYYLSDNTVELIQPWSFDDGKRVMAKFLGRCRLSKDCTLDTTVTPSMVDESDQLLPVDLYVGKELSVLGRMVSINSCDGFTGKWLIENGIQSNPVVGGLKQREKESSKNITQTDDVPPRELPIGSEEDSLQSVKFLCPNQPPTQNLRKLLDLGDVRYRFCAKFSTHSPVDAERRFVLTFFPCDDTLVVFEENVPNSGIVGGLWLKRSKIGNITENDLKIGNEIEIYKRKFIITDADEFTKNHLKL